MEKTQRFTLLKPNKTGIHFNNKIQDTKEANILKYSNYYGGAGVGVGDFNGDDLQDIFFAGNLVSDKLYFNTGNFTFNEVTTKAGILEDGGWSTGVTVADVNNDGHLDIYVSRELYDDEPELRKNLLYINKGDGTFSEQAEAYGIANSERTRHATFIDYDKDGWLDLLLLTQPPNPGSYSKYSGTTLLKPEYSIKLYKNNGKQFTDVTEAAGLSLTGFPNAVSASDFNNDGYTDLYIANDFYAPDFLLINNKDGTFSRTLKEAINHMPYYSMGVDVADINNDGFLDIFVVDMVAEDNFRQKSSMSGMNPKAFKKVVDNGGHYQYMYNALHLNNGNTTFKDVAQFTGMASTDWSWSNLIADFNNDGLKDTYITNGLLRDIRNTDADKKVGTYITETANKWVKSHPDGGDVDIFDILDLNATLDLLPSQPIKNYAYENTGDLAFKNVAVEWGLDQASFSNGSAYADFDNDGDLDLVVNNINEQAFIFQNNSDALPNSNYLRIQLKNKDNKPVLGSRVTLFTGTQKQTVETSNVRGIYSTSESLVHFGLGSKKMIDSLWVVWPNGEKTIQKELKSNQLVTINKASSRKINKGNKEAKQRLFVEITDDFSIVNTHEENVFNDFDVQILLPHQLSKFGPSLAKADVNNDGLEDVFIGGASGKSAALYLQDETGSFNLSNSGFWKKESPYEDIDALFFDVNNDGFQDLYVVSGGNAYGVNDAHYLDRLYMNDGHGQFTKGAILNGAPISGSIVKAADFDGDGDLDLFVGGRHTPHQYPLPASSMLLKNENGRLVNVTNIQAADFNDMGMVTDAVWVDFDADDDLDLIVVGEWMPITIFKNNEGQFIKEDNEDLRNTVGWWFSIEMGDFDGDGDQDFIAGNLGLNYKYKTSIEKPFDVYYSDFDANGFGDIVLGYYNEEKHFPVRGFSCSAQQIPNLKMDIQKYDIFASLEMDEVYGAANLQEALHYKADTFASSYIENLGNGSFVVSTLPNEAQLSSINDILVDDFNKDGVLDILTIGNLFTSEIETPRNDAGTGNLLLGDGKGAFNAIPFVESGFFANKDAKKAITIEVNKQKLIVVANNNDRLQSFALENK
ncbi:MAG: hypothetical protein COA50_10040 [Flavobacteriaceae bacterium]|nr:MAG: hypothetical protein COA50_10040 [Flavobacteriaceae bacterium]